MHKKNKNYWTFMFKYTNIELTVKRNKKQEGNKRMKGNVIVGQSGGPTAAINASLAGVYRTAKDRGADKVYGMLHGIQGLLKEKYIDLSDHIKTELDAELLKRTPAAFLGSCRYKLPEIHEHFSIQQKLACRDYYVYDFALPMLLFSILAEMILWIQSRNYRIMPLYSVMQSASLDVRRRLIMTLHLPIIHQDMEVRQNISEHL